MSNQEPPATIARLLILKDDQILVIKRNKNGHKFIALPGGHIDAGETVEQAAEREAKEELSINVEVMQLQFVYQSPRWGVQYFLHAKQTDSLEPQLHEGSEELASTRQGDNTYEPCWMTVDEAVEGILPESVALAIKDGVTTGWPEHPVIIQESTE